MTSYQRKSISMGVFKPPAVDQNFGYVANDWSVTNTSWVRIWVPWVRIAPHGWNNPATDTNNTYYPGEAGGEDLAGIRVMDYVAMLDAQIKYARQCGLSVILVFDFFPQWANGVNDHRVPPADVSLSSPWAAYLAWAVSRWSVLNPNHNGAYADVFEVCNEPNLYRGGLSTVQRADVAARMMMTAQGIQNVGWTSPRMAAPALADNSERVTFTYELLMRTGTWGFTPQNGTGNVNWVWTQHNYGDLEHGAAMGGWERAQEIRDWLKAFQWRAWPYLDPANPYVFLTEGGVRLGGSSPSSYQANTTTASNRTRDVYNRMHNDLLAGGQGIAMFTNYLDVTSLDPSGNCGLREPGSHFPAYATRPLYSTWGGLSAP